MASVALEGGGGTVPTSGWLGGGGGGARAPGTPLLPPPMIVSEFINGKFAVLSCIIKFAQSLTSIINLEDFMQ